jgi:PAS domain S-box-containing protein
VAVLKYGATLALLLLLVSFWVYRLWREIGHRKAAEMREHSRSNILEMLAKGEPLPKVLESIVRSVERQNVDMLCSILLFDRQGKHPVKVVAPSLPDFHKAATGGIDIDSAAFTEKRVIPGDFATCLAPLKKSAAGAGLGACFSQPLLSSSGQVLGIFAIYHREARTTSETDFSIVEQFARLSSIAIERSIAAEMLHEREAHFRLLTEDVLDVVWKVDRDFRFTYISPADERLRGYRADEVIGHPIFEMFTEESVASVTELIQRRQEAERNGTVIGSATFEAQHRCKDGSLLWGEVLSIPDRDANGAITGYHGITREITERKRAEEERKRLEQRIKQIEKAESLGRMAGAIAHNFNNMLMVVMGNLELALDELPHELKARSNIAEAMKASQRAAEIGRFMLTYLGQSIRKAEPIDAANAYREACAHLNVSVPANVHLKTVPPTLDAVIQVDVVHLTQILANLISNAVDAIGEREGEIVLAAQVVKGTEVGESKLFPIDWEPKAKEYACISIADTGCGMDAVTLEKIFDPFFTTKSTGRGMGLPVVSGLVRACQGALAVESHLGRGATFKVFFPVLEQDFL